jgi:hypothetical protein
MKQYLAAVSLAAVLAQSAEATTFPSLTTLYVVGGVISAGTDNTGPQTVFQCSNVSGVTTSIRFLVLNPSGAVLNSHIFEAVQHGSTINVSTHFTVAYAIELELLPAATGVNSGVVNIESLQSAVFCTAAIIDGAAAVPDGVSPHLVRVNPHPGTVE